MSILSDIQSKLNVPKGQTNQFGNYKYRSCEDIVEAVKPLLAEYHCALVISDQIEMIGDRYYVRATASISEDGKVIAEVSAFAREPSEKKGMDLAQLTGATSSYARKYALNGLFAIDDTKDADTMDNRVATFKFKRGEKDKVMDKVLNALTEGDGVAIASVLHEYDSPEAKIAVWALFNSSERSAIKAMLSN